jgi:hypothetical protein
MIPHAKSPPQAFRVGDLVLRRVWTKKGKHKLSPSREGPYLIAEVLRPGAYRLQEINYVTFPIAWNIEQPKMFYP